MPSIESSFPNLGYHDDQEASEDKVPVWEQNKRPSIWHQTFIGRMSKRGGGPSIDTKRHILTTGGADGQKHFMIRMGKRGEHSRMMKIEGN